MTSPDGPDIPWCGWNSAESWADAERCGLLEWQVGITDDPAESARWLAEADEIRERWDQPRHQFSSLAEIIDELAAIAVDVRDIAVDDCDALEDLGLRASGAGLALETFACELREADCPPEDTETS